MTLGKKAGAEFFGTFWLVFGGCGSAVLAATFPNTGIGFLGVAFAFGLTVLTMAYAIGHISGCHLNPAVSIGLAVGKRIPYSDLLPYIIAQVLGGAAGAGVLYLIASGKEGFTTAAGFATNGYGLRSPGGYPLSSCFLAEFVLTFFFLMIILGSTHGNAPRGFAPIAIGLGLTLIPPRRHSRHQSIGEPRAQHRPSPLRRCPGSIAAVAILACAHLRRSRSRHHLSDAYRRLA
jgi:aquaporin Z